MFSPLCRSGSILLILATLEPGTWAQAIPGDSTSIPAGRGIRRTTRVFVVDDTPNPCRFSASLQPAIDAAADGDVVRVQGGTYSSFVVDGKDIHLIGEDRPLVSGGGTVTVRNVAGTAVLRGFELSIQLTASDNQGFVWVEDCTGRGANVVNSRLGAFRYEPRIAFPFVNRLSADLGSTFVAYHSMLKGHDGSSAECVGCSGSDSGGTSLFVRRSSLGYLIGSRSTGGSGGDGTICVECFDACYDGGCGGHGLDVDASSSAYALDTVLQGGSGGFEPCGAPPCPGQSVIGPTEIVSRDSGEFWIDSPVRVGEPLQIHARGPAGWSLYVRHAAQCTPSFEPAFRGYAVVPVSLPPALLGVLPASGELDLTLPTGLLLPPGAEARVLYVQADFYDPITGISVLGTPTAVVVHRDPCL